MTTCASKMLQPQQCRLFPRHPPPPTGACPLVQHSSTTCVLLPLLNPPPPSTPQPFPPPPSPPLYFPPLSGRLHRHVVSCSHRLHPHSRQVSPPSPQDTHLCPSTCALLASACKYRSSHITPQVFQCRLVSRRARDSPPLQLVIRES